MAKGNILIVEDESVVALDIQLTLKRLGYAVLGIAATGEDAIRKAEAGRPDLVLMDIILRGAMDGIEAAQVISTRLGLPVIYMTSHTDEPTLQRAKATGPFGYVLKPFEEKELLAGIEMALHKHREEVQLRASERALRRTSDELELRVQERTAELAQANARLRAEIAEREQTEAALRRSQAMLHGLFEFAPDAILVVSRDGRIVRLNAQAERTFGYRREEVVGQPVEVLIPERFRRQHVPHRQRYVTQPRTRPMGQTRDLFGRRKDGSEFPVMVSLGVLATEEGTFVLSIVRDVTEQKLLEEQYPQAQKMEAIGRLAGGVAHDFNNLLTVITGYSDLLLDLPVLTGEARGLLEEVAKAGERAAGLTRQLLAFSRRQVLDPQRLDLNVLVGDVEKLLRRLIGEDITLACALDPDLPPVTADRGQFEQVLMNLAVNARDAMPQGGRLTLTTHPVRLDEATGAGLGLAPGPYVVLRVSDTGCGMDAATLARIFEPFFTTKGVGKGTGLGLAMVFGIVHQSGGSVQVASEPGRGATFTIYLPAVGEPVRPAAAPAKPTFLPRGRGTVLLVEDEDSVRGVARQFLELAGYTVLEGRDGVEALALSQAHAGPIDLLLTDVVMPEMGGPDLAARLVPGRPGLKVLFMTGYTDNPQLLEALDHRAAQILEKPFGPALLAGRVRDILDAAGEDRGRVSA